MKSKTIVRSVSHSLKFANTGKLSKYNDFISDYRSLLKEYVDYLWNAHIEIKDKRGNVHILDVENEKLEVPSFFDYNEIEASSTSSLSGRAKQCCLDQALGMVKAALEKQRKRQFHLDNGQTLKKYKQNGFTKPSTKNANIELRSLCVEFIVNESESDNALSGFVKLKPLGKSYGTIIIPVNLNKRDFYWKNKGFERLTSMLFYNDKVDFRWRGNVELKSEGEIIGVDTGKTDSASFSNGLCTPRINRQGKSIDDVYKKLARKHKGSKAFQKAKTELKNFINWQFNELKRNNFFENKKQVNLEKVWNVRFRKRTSRLMSHWSNPLIVGKLKSLCEISGVHVHEENSTYMSQRCSGCGLVLKKNRKGKVYKCSICGLEIDADVNAAINHTKDLPPIDWTLRKKRLNMKGFFWNQNGLFTLEEEELSESLLATELKE